MLNALINNQWLVILMIIVLGLIIGSFLNVVIYRLPIMMQPAENSAAFSLCSPASHCPCCQRPLHWFDKFPLLSYLFLLGRCRYCKKIIRWRYPLVEALTALLSVMIALHFPSVTKMCAALIFTWWLIPMVFIDIDHQLLPDELTLSLLWLGLLVNADGMFVSPASSIFGAALGYASFWLMAKMYYLCRRVEGLGQGDFKLFAALGAWLGWQALPRLLMIASLLGLLISVLLLLAKRHRYGDAFSFGPCLAISGWFCLIVAFHC